MKEHPMVPANKLGDVVAKVQSRRGGYRETLAGLAAYMNPQLYAVEIAHDDGCPMLRGKRWCDCCATVTCAGGSAMTSPSRPTQESLV